MLPILKLIPNKVWLGLAVISLIMVSGWVGQREGYLRAERDFNKASLTVLEDSVSDLNITLGEAIDLQRKARDEAQKLSDEVLKSREKHNKDFKELLNEAKNSQPGSDCDNLSPEYIKLLESLFPRNKAD